MYLYEKLFSFTSHFEKHCVFWKVVNVYHKILGSPVYLCWFVFIILQEMLPLPSSPLIKEKWHLPPHSSSLSTPPPSPWGGGIMLKLKSGALQNYKIKKGGVNGTWYIQPHYLFLNFVQTCIFLPSLNFICIQPRPSTKLCSP